MARTFGGSGYYLYNNSAAENGAFPLTLAAIIRSTSSSWGAVMACGNSTSSGWIYYKRTSTEVMQVSCLGGTSQISTLVVNQDLWFGVGVVMTSGGTRFYRYRYDTRALSTEDLSAVAFNNSPAPNAFRVGSNCSGGDYFSGGIARIGWWSGLALTDGEMQTWFLGQLTRSRPRVFYEIGGYNSPEVDWSGNSFHGSISGSPAIADHAPLGPLFGRQTYSPSSSGTQIIYPTGIASAGAFGTTTLSHKTLTPSGIPSAEAFGAPTITGGLQTITGAGAIASAQVFGTITARHPATSIYPLLVAEENGSNVAGLSHTIKIPAGTPGEVVIVEVTFAGSTTPGDSWPAGWTQLYAVANTIAARARYRPTDGSEGATITVTTTESVSSTYRVQRLSQHYSGTPPTAATATGTSTAPNPPSHTPGGGTKGFFWLAVNHSAGANPSSYPSSYTGGAANNTPSINCCTAKAQRSLLASSTDPGTFAIPASVAWVAATIAIHPALSISPTGIATAQAIGTVTAIGPRAISPSGIASAQAFGTTQIIGPRTITVVGISSAQAFGTTQVTPLRITCAGIASAEAFGTLNAAVLSIAPFLGASSYLDAYTAIAVGIGIMAYAEAYMGLRASLLQEAIYAEGYLRINVRLHSGASTKHYATTQAQITWVEV